MGKKKNRIDTSPEQSPLTDNPFAQLAGMKDDLPAQTMPKEQPKAEIIPEDEVVERPWRVAKTRKGGWPVRLEKRAAGKVVTVIGPVEGDRKFMLKQLRKRCSAGGQVAKEFVEVQGDHVETVKAMLDKQ